jgi:hypothetical protein
MDSRSYSVDSRSYSVDSRSYSVDSRSYSVDSQTIASAHNSSHDDLCIMDVSGNTNNKWIADVSNNQVVTNQLNDKSVVKTRRRKRDQIYYYSRS